jgi:hypothetical protein
MEENFLGKTAAYIPAETPKNGVVSEIETWIPLRLAVDSSLFAQPSA